MTTSYVLRMEEEDGEVSEEVVRSKADKPSRPIIYLKISKWGGVDSSMPNI